MTQLRDLLYGYGEGQAVTPSEFMVYNTNTQTSANGGQCCLWTVPTGVSYAVFEMWSGGGSGAGGCCCMQGGGAGSGGYAIKGCTVAPGQQIRICASTSGCCSNSGQTDGICGCCTYICSLGGGGQPTWNSYVDGGRCVTVQNRCFYYANCYSCCSQCYCCGGGSGNVDFCIWGTTGSGHASQYCYDHGFQMAANAPMTGAGNKPGPNGCCGWGGSNAFGNFPGGGGNSAQAYGGGCCCGGPGGGGLVYVVYY